MTNAPLERYVMSLPLGQARMYALKLGLHLENPNTTCVPKPRGLWVHRVEENVKTIVNPGGHSCSPCKISLHFVPDGQQDKLSGANLVEAARLAACAVNYLVFSPSRHVTIVAERGAQLSCLEDEVLGEASRRDALERVHGRVNFLEASLLGDYNEPLDVTLVSTGSRKALPTSLSDWDDAALLVKARRLRIFTSIPERFWDAGNQPHTPLVRLLNFAKEYSDARNSETPGKVNRFDSRFEQQVCKQLEAWGLKVVSQVPVAGYWIDLAVKNSFGGYALGVECDGAHYHKAAYSKEADSRRQQDLEDLGWNMHRIWSTTWFHDNEMAAAKLRDAVHLALPGNPLPVL